MEKRARRCGLKDNFAWHEKSLVIVSLSIMQMRLQFLADKTWRMWVQTRSLFRMYFTNNEDTVDLPVHFTFSLVILFYRDSQNRRGPDLQEHAY